MADFKILTLAEKELWTSLLAELPGEQQDIYYSPEYYTLYEKLGDGQARCFIFRRGSDLALYPFLVNSVTALGYDLDKEYYDIQGAYGYNGIVSSSYQEAFIRDFYATFFSWCIDQNIISEFTRFHPILGNQRFAKNYLDVIYDRETVALDTSQDYDHIWQKEYSSINRNMIRKATKLNFTSECTSAPKTGMIEKFIAIYTSTMSRISADGYYFFNQSYFKNVFNLLQNRFFLCNVNNAQGVTVCSGLFFHYDRYFHYHLSGRTAEADNSINNYLLDSAIRLAMAKNAVILHIGGGRTKAQDDSLLRFKANFSKTRLPFYIGKKVHNMDIYKRVVEQWTTQYPHKILYNNNILKYRYR